MRLVKLFALLTLAAAVVAGQDFEIDTTTPEGQIIQQIGSTDDPQIKLQMLEQFVQKYPDHEAIPWILAQIPPIYAALNQPAKSLAACEKLLAKDPTNAAAAHACLKTAEAQKDPELLKKWALLANAAAVKRLAKPKPDFEYQEDEDTWNEQVEFAKQVKQYSEWSLYNAALQAQDPAQKAALVDALRQANPESEHLPQLTQLVFAAYVQAGKLDEAVKMADAADATGKASTGMMLVAADHYFNNKQPDKSLAYCKKIIAANEGKAAPAGVDAAAWAKQTKAELGRAYWMMGVTYSTQGKYVSADKALRKALPNVKGNAPLLAGALFHLGLANFKLGNKSGSQDRILAAFKYTKQCAAMKSPFQAQARKNLAAIQSQYRIK